MRTKLLFVPLLALALPSCSAINNSMRTMEANREEIEMSTRAINENIQAIEQANVLIEENRHQLEEINKTLKKIVEKG